MAKLDTDQIYARFLAEAREEDGNFYFVRIFDTTLYEKLCKIERNAVLNLNDSGMELRNALEIFMRNAMPQQYYDEVLDENARRKNLSYSNTADIIDYQRVFQRHRELGVDTNLFDTVRLAGNTFHHEKAGRNAKLPKRTYQTLCNALAAMHKMLLSYFSRHYPEELKGSVFQAYNRDKQPYGDKMVCAIIETLDSTACEKQVLCSRLDDLKPDLNHYYLLRVYKAYDASEGAIRDEKVLSNLWSNSLRGIPNIVRYAPLAVEYNGEDPRSEKKYILAYDFGPYKPCPLHVNLLKELSDHQKLMIMHDIAAGVRVLHNAGIYHRNLQPNSVFVFFDRNSDFVQAKLVGFEYAKIEGDNATVFKRVATLQEEDPSTFFSATMKQGLKNRQISERLDWAKEDIYSLGALFYFILTGTRLVGRFDPDALGDKADDEFKKLMTAMLSPGVAARPDITDVMNYLEPYYQKVVWN